LQQSMLPLLQILLLLQTMLLLLHCKFQTILLILYCMPMTTLALSTGQPPRICPAMVHAICTYTDINCCSIWTPTF